MKWVLNGRFLGIFEKPAYIDSALVEQDSPPLCFNLKYCSTPLTVGKDGISEYLVPTLDEYEASLLEECKLVYNTYSYYKISLALLLLLLVSSAK